MVCTNTPQIPLSPHQFQNWMTGQQAPRPQHVTSDSHTGCPSSHNGCKLKKNKKIAISQTTATLAKHKLYIKPLYIINVFKSSLLHRF
jgi:hypothetical protein